MDPFRDWKFSHLFRIQLESLGKRSQNLLEDSRNSIERDDGIRYDISEMVTVYCGSNATEQAPYWYVVVFLSLYMLFGMV